MGGIISTILKKPVQQSVVLRGAKVPVTVPFGYTWETILAFEPFQHWMKQMDAADAFTVNSIDLQGVDMFGKRVGFVKLNGMILNLYCYVQLM